MATKGKETLHEIPCGYKNVTFGDKTVSMGFSISRNKEWTPNKIMSIFVGKRLTVKLFAGTSDASRRDGEGGHAPG